MLRPWGFAALFLVCAVPVMAQVDENPTTPPQETPPTQQPTPAPRKAFPKYDISAGYSFQTYKAASGSTSIHLQGWYGDLVYNLFSWGGAEAQISGDYKTLPVPLSNTHVNIGIYSLMAGPRIYPLRHHKLEPWAHILFGGAIYHDFFPANGGFPSKTDTFLSKALEFGGGFDLNLREHWGFRLIEIDYVKTQFNGSYNQPGYRIAVGATYRFGEK